MSKESYARGFCKAAEAAGVDPQALIKLAANVALKTDGFAPKSVVDVGTGAVPDYRPPVYDYSTGTGKLEKDESASPMATTRKLYPIWRELIGNSQAALSENPGVVARAKANPKYLNWLIAHNKAIKKVTEAAKPTLGAAGGIEDPVLMKDLAKIYHDSMANSTGGVSRVVAESAKK